MTRRRALAFVSIVPIALWLACWPFAGVGVNDDFGYAHVAGQLLATGRLRYNGWCNPILGAQAAWGAAFAWALGFSHDALRLSTLPLACACAALTYALHRRVGAPPRWSAFAALLLVASPLFVPWAASFMTDVPGLAFTLLVLHAFVGVAMATSARHVALWAVAVTIAGLVGGSIRQTNFVLAGVAFLLAMWPRRRDGRSLAIIGAALAVHVAATAVALRWHARQPYAVPEMMPRLSDAPRAAKLMLLLALDGAMLALPLFVAAFRAGGVSARARRIAAVATLVGCVAVALALPAAAPLVRGPFMGNTITRTGMLTGGYDAPGERPIVFAPAARLAVGVATWWAIAVGGSVAWRRRREWLIALRPAVNGDGPPFAVVGIVAIGIAYGAMLLPRASEGLIFDRYLLPLLPIASAATLYALRDRLVARGPGVAAWATLALFAAYGVGATGDHFAELRARDRIAADLMRDGVPRAAIANGLTFDAWTQLEAAGHINDARVVVPPDGYRAGPRDAQRAKLFWFLPKTPAVEPRWIVADLAAPPADVVGRRVYAFRAILPPRERWIEVRAAPRVDAASPFASDPADTEKATQ